MGSKSGIRDNRQRGSVGEFLSQNITPNSELSFVSVYCTIYAYHTGLKGDWIRCGLSSNNRSLCKQHSKERISEVGSYASYTD